MLTSSYTIGNNILTILTLTYIYLPTEKNKNVLQGKTITHKNQWYIYVHHNFFTYC